MNKFNFITVCLLIFIVITLTIDLFRTITGFNEIDKVLESISGQNENLATLVQEIQLNTKETISGFSLHLTKKITEISKDAEEQNRNIGIALLEVKNSSRLEIAEVKSLITFYTEEVKKLKAAENLLVFNNLVESDNLVRQFLSKGSVEYKMENFTAAVIIYKNILDIDPSSAEAQCYFNTSLYYQNPGDWSNFHRIKNNLIPLLEGNILAPNEKKAVINVLAGISGEEGDGDSLKQYQNALQQLEIGE